MRYPGTAVGVLAATGVGALAYASLIERNWYALREVTVPVLPPGAPPLRVLHLSDLHLTPSQRRKSDWVRDLASLRPDLVVGMAVRGSAAMAVLQGQHYRILDLKPVDRLEDIYASIREVAAAVGHPERGAARIAQMQHDLARIPRPGGGKVAAYYQRRGFMTGTGTLIDDLMRRLGLVNLARRLGKPVLAQISLEQMVAARPDYLIVESATNRVTDQGTEMLHHPALDGIPRISVPQAWTVCGSPAYVQAARSMAQQIERHRRAAHH